MPKISREQINDDEMKILNELQKNSNQSINMIARHSGFSNQKVRGIIKRLEGKGIIWGNTTVFDEQKTGLTHFVLLVKRNSKKINENTISQIVTRKIEDFAAEMGVTIENSFYVHGEYDWIMMFTAKDLRQANKFSDSVLALNPGILEKISILQTLIFVKKHNVLNPERMKLKEFF